MASAADGVFERSGASVACESGGELVLGAFFGLRVGLLVFGRGGAPKSAKSTTGNSAVPLTASSITISDQLPVGAKKGDEFPFPTDSGLLLFLGVGKWARSGRMASSETGSVSESSESSVAESNESESSSSEDSSVAGSRSISSSLSSSPRALPLRLTTLRFLVGAEARGFCVSCLTIWRAELAGMM